MTDHLKLKLHFFLFLFILSLLTTRLSAQEITDLIHTVHLTAGQTDSVLISDEFYAKNYGGIKFIPNKNVKVSYDTATGMARLTADKNFEGMDLIDFMFKNEQYEIPVFSEIASEHEFSYKPSGEVKSVFLFGSFNGWNRSSYPMTNDNGTYKIKISLEPGRYEYKFFVDGKELVDPENHVKVPNGMGDYNSVVNILPRHTDKIFLHALGKSSTGNSLTLSFYYEKENQKEPLALNNIIALMNDKKIPESKIDISGNKINVVLSGRTFKRNAVVRVAVNQDGQTTNVQNVRIINGVPAGHEKNVTLQDQIIYSIMIDRFYDGDKSNDKPVVLPGLSYKANYQGGDFQGIIDKINGGYFDSLGVNTLWISPVVDNPDSAYREYPAPHRLYTGYHGYWPLHSYKVEEHFGTMSLLKKLVADAHKHKIKILIDYVAHHVFIKNPLYKEHPDWFGTLYLPDGRRNLRLWDEERLTTWFDTFLPTFNYVGSVKAREAMTDNAVWWLKKTGADGFRHDAVKHIPNVFWRLLTKKIKEEIEIPEHRSIYQLGETFGSYKLVNSYVNDGQLNAQFNFNLYDVAMQTFLGSNTSFKTLDNEIHKSFSVFGANNLMGNIMDSHDKVRFMAFADGEVPLNGGDASEIGWDNPPGVKHKSSYDRLKLYLSYLLTVPGIPVIDYGDEIGMTGAADPDNRRMMKFGDQLTDWEKETLTDVRKIIKIRDNNSALRYGDFYTVRADSDCYVFIRSDMNERVLVALNKSYEVQKIEINLPAFYKLHSGKSLYGGKDIVISGNKAAFEVPADSFMIFRLQ